MLTRVSELRGTERTVASTPAPVRPARSQARTLSRGRLGKLMLDTQTACVSLAECDDEPPGRWMASLRAGPLGIRNFRLLSAGQLASTIGDYCYVVALPWLVLSTHGSPVELGSVLACYGIPRAALITVGGSLADRVSPRRLMQFSDAGRCVLTALFAIFAAAHVTSLAALGPVAALLGAGAALFMPASYA